MNNKIKSVPSFLPDKTGFLLFIDTTPPIRKKVGGFPFYTDGDDAN